MSTLSTAGMVPVVQPWRPRPVRRGDLDAIAEMDTGFEPIANTDTWLDAADRHRLHQVTVGSRRTDPQAGADCKACPHPRDRHDGWGCSAGCDCKVSVIYLSRGQ